jgi:hypothetical protein
MPEGTGLGSFRFARRYSGNAKTFYRIGNGRRHSKKSVYWFLFLQVLRCFNSLGLLPTPLLKSIKTSNCIIL